MFGRRCKNLEHDLNKIMYHVDDEWRNVYRKRGLIDPELVSTINMRVQRSLDIVGI
jgi:hypothetical protein